MRSMRTPLLLATALDNASQFSIFEALLNRALKPSLNTKGEFRDYVLMGMIDVNHCKVRYQLLDNCKSHLFVKIQLENVIICTKFIVKKQTLHV